MLVEPAFPRGRNVEVEEDDDPLRKRERHINYGVRTYDNREKRHARPKDRKRALFYEKEEEEEELERSLRADNLSFRTLQEGMLVLACVSRVLKTSLEITMPGRLHGEVPISAISVVYSEQLKTMEQRKGTTRYCKPLSDFYSKGDLLYVKVMNKCKGKAICSLNPTDLHSEFVASQVVPGLVLAATITAEEDHGYSMETGIRNVRAFLPQGNLNRNSTALGKNLFCSVQKVTQRSEQGALLILRAFKESEPRTLDVGMINIDQLVPGCIIPFTVGPPVHNGLRGTLFDDTVSAFVNQNMFTTPICKPEDYTLFKQMNVTLLYVFPVTKQVFVSMVQYMGNKIPDGKTMPPGSIIEKAYVVSVTKYGVWFRFLKCRGFLSKSIIVKGLGPGCNYEDTVLSGKYHEGSVHTLYVIRYDVLDRSYIVCDKMENASEETRSSNDINVGQTYIGKIIKMENGTLHVNVGDVEGFIPKQYLDPKTVIKEGATIRMVAVTSSTFTNHVKFRRKDVKILRFWSQIHPAPDKPLAFDGLVVEELADHFVVAFFNNLRGIMYKSQQKYEAKQNQEKLRQLCCGCIERFTVHQYDKTSETLILSLPDNMKWIEMVTVTVKAIHPTRVEVVDRTNQQEGIIPLELFSVFHEHALPYMNLLKEGQELNTVKLRAGIYSVRDVRYFQYKPFLVEQVKKGDILRASCCTDNGELFMNLLLIDYDHRLKIGLPEDIKRNVPNGSIMMVEIKEIQHETWGSKFVNSYRLNDVCKLGIESVFLYITDYLEDWICLVERFKQEGMSFAKFNIAQMVDCTVEEVGEEREMIVRVHNPSDLECTAKGIAMKARTSNQEAPIRYNVGDRLSGRVLWIDVEQQLLHVCIDPPIVQRIGLNQWKFSDQPSQYRRVDVLFHNDYVKVCCINGRLQDKFPPLLVPNRCHYNDMRKQQPPSDKISVHVAKQFGPFLIGLEKKDLLLFNSFAKQPLKFDPEINIQTEIKKNVTKDNEADESGSKPLAKSEAKSKTKPKKKKKSANANNQLLSVEKQGKREKTNGKKALNQMASLAVNEKKVDTLVKLNKKKKKQKKSPSFPTIDQLDGCDSDLFTVEQLDGAETDIQTEGKTATKRKASANRKDGKGLPGTTNFWDSTPVYKQPQSDSSEDENSDDERNQVVSKKRLTAKERFQLIKLEEDRLRKIEEELANPSTDPHTPDQFDRLVLAQPNNSMLWIRYMVLHMESAELDKARAVARKALKTINFREEAELLNVWIALLNLEIRYETVDSFKEVLQEAIQYNDAFKVYSRVLDILIDCNKHTEVRELLELLQKKFRKQNDMWYLVADAWYRIGQIGKAKPLLSQALKSLPNRDHIPLIVKFAFLHNRHGNRDEAHLLFEQILTSYPKRTDIWSQYVDMLVKDGLVENARQILERAVVQRLPMKNMKTLYTKYVNFEEKHGNRDSVRRVKQMATDYVQGQLNHAGIVSK